MKRISLIFAAGKGSRLAPLTDTLPKPLSPLYNDTSIIERHMDFLAPYVDKFIIVTHYKEDQIIHKIGEVFQGKPVKFVHQSSPKWGTGDCLRVGLKEEDISPEDIIFITHSDEVLSQDCYAQIGENINNGQRFALAQYIEDRERLKQFGIIQEENGNYKRVIEKPQIFISNLVNIGMFCVHGDIINYIPEVKPEFLQENQEEYIFIAMDAYAADHDLPVIKTEDWMTISNLEDLDKVQRFFVQQPDY